MRVYRCRCGAVVSGDYRAVVRRSSLGVPKMPVYTPAEFISRLAVGSLPEPAHIAIHGLARTDAVGALLFCPTPRCDNWLPLPLSIVDLVEHIATLRCGDHEHPYVKISLKMPSDDNPEAIALLALLTVAKSIIAQFRATCAPGDSTDLDRPTVARQDAEGCEYYEFDGQIWLCCCRSGHCECGGLV